MKSSVFIDMSFNRNGKNMREMNIQGQRPLNISVGQRPTDIESHSQKAVSLKAMY